MPHLYPREMFEQLVQERVLTLDSGEKETLVTLVDTVFFTSLMLEEGEPARVAIVYEEEGAVGLTKIEASSTQSWGENGPPFAWDVTEIARRPFEPRTLAKISVGLDYGAHLVVVGGRASELWIDGIARRNLYTDGGPVTRIAAPRPGVIVFERGEDELLRYDAGRRVSTPIDVLADTGPIRDAAWNLADIQGRGDVFGSFVWTVEQLIRQMRAKGHGAILALMPTLPDEAVLAALKFRRIDPQVLTTRMREQSRASQSWIATMIATANTNTSAKSLKDLEAKRSARATAREALEAAIADVAHLSAIDGAVLAGPGLAIYGAGHLIRGNAKFERIKALDAAMTTTEPWSENHGARHQAALSFAYDNPGGIAFVVSEDGPVSCTLRVDNRVVVWSVRVPET